jgi:Tfp pilus assembly protein PilO
MKKQLPQKKEISSLLASRREDIEAGWAIESFAIR